MIEYFPAEDIKARVHEIIEFLRFDHIRPDSIYCIRSRGSHSRKTIARIHSMGRIWQSVGFKVSYIVEVISERFDDLSREEQDTTLIHELLHIPHGFRGGFRPHKNYVTEEIVKTWYKRYKQKKVESTTFGSSK
jgi:predicted metallopeptidase